MTTPRPGVNLFGHLSTNLGLGVAARNTARLLEDGPWEFSAVDVRTATMPWRQDDTWEHRGWRGGAASPLSVNLFHFNPPEIAAELRLRPAWLETAGRVNACVPFWELPNLPDSWLPVIEAMDVVAAPTLFVGEAVRTSVPGAAIVHFPQTVYVPDGVGPDRDAWGFGADETVFALSFDVNSDPARKNPWAAIQAFSQARPQLPPGARLVINVNNPATRMGAAHMDELRAAIGTNDAVSLVTRSLTYREVLSLYASADVYVSLHRAEGLGLGLLESMMLGTPVLATAYSGNMDFMSAEDSALVGYDLVPVEASQRGSYSAGKIGHGQVWAEPRLDEAVAQMVRLANDRPGRLELAERAQEAALATQTDPQRSAAMNDLISRAPSRTGDTRLAPPGIATALYWRARRVVGSRLRDAGLR
jgi:glycosyltransferase involved in cell wall biosynthesis